MSIYNKLLEVISLLTFDMLIIVIQIVVWFIIINCIKIYLTNDLEKN